MKLILPAKSHLVVLVTRSTRMPREDQPVVRSSTEAGRIWEVYESVDVDENFHPLTPSPLSRSRASHADRPVGHFVAPIPATSSTQPLQLPPLLLPYQRQVRPWKLSDSRVVERCVYREALREVEENRLDELSTLQDELRRVRKQRDLLLRHNVVMAKCMEHMANS